MYHGNYNNTNYSVFPFRPLNSTQLNSPCTHNISECKIDTTEKNSEQISQDIKQKLKKKESAFHSRDGRDTLATTINSKYDALLLRCACRGCWCILSALLPADAHNLYHQFHATHLMLLLRFSRELFGE